MTAVERVERPDRQDVLNFLGHAFRNIDLPKLSPDDLGDIADGLRSYARAAIAALPPAVGEMLEAEITQLLENWFEVHDGEAIDCPAIASAIVGNNRRKSARIEALEEVLEHFIDIVDGTEETGFDPHVEQMLMDTAEAARALLSDSPQ